MYIITCIFFLLILFVINIFSLKMTRRKVCQLTRPTTVNQTVGTFQVTMETKVTFMEVGKSLVTKPKHSSLYRQCSIEYNGKFLWYSDKNNTTTLHMSTAIDILNIVSNFMSSCSITSCQNVIK